MNRLNNKGWGLPVFLTILAFFIFVFLIVVIIAFRVDRENNIPLVEKQFININNL